jgi:quercetin dioxygenase-like cupin family protein
MTLIKLILTTVVFFTSTFAFSQSSKNNKMNLKELHKDSIGVQTNVLFPATEGKVISLQILKGNTLKEHLSKVPALLVCVTGNAIYEDEKGIKVTLKSGDFIKIEPNVKHWINGIKDSNLLLIK